MKYDGRYNHRRLHHLSPDKLVTPLAPSQYDRALYRVTTGSDDALAPGCRHDRSIERITCQEALSVILRYPLCGNILNMQVCLAQVFACPVVRKRVQRLVVRERQLRPLPEIRMDGMAFKRLLTAGHRLMRFASPQKDLRMPHGTQSRKTAQFMLLDGVPRPLYAPQPLARLEPQVRERRKEAPVASHEADERHRDVTRTPLIDHELSFGSSKVVHQPALAYPWWTRNEDRLAAVPGSLEQCPRFLPADQGRGRSTVSGSSSVWDGTMVAVPPRAMVRASSCVSASGSIPNA